MGEFKEVLLSEEVIISGLYSFLYYEFAKGYHFKGECHEFWELVYVDRGSIQLRKENQYMKLEAGELFLHPPNQMHGLRVLDKEGSNVFIIGFATNSEAVHMMKDQIVIADKELKEIIAKIYQAGKESFEDCRMEDGILKILNKPKETTVFGCQQLLKIHLELLLIKSIRKSKKPKEIRKREGLSSKSIMADIENVLIAHLEEKHYLLLLVNELGLSKRKIQYVVKEEKGLCISNYVRNLRIIKAKEMLRERAYTITEIAEALGYSSVHYFSTQFKSLCKLTPTEFSKSIKSKGQSMSEVIIEERKSRE